MEVHETFAFHWSARTASWKKKSKILVPHPTFSAGFLHFGRYKMHLMVCNATTCNFFFSAPVWGHFPERQNKALQLYPSHVTSLHSLMVIPNPIFNLNKLFSVIISYGTKTYNLIPWLKARSLFGVFPLTSTGFGLGQAPKKTNPLQTGELLDSKNAIVLYPSNT